jgi:hypothetical protein
MHFGGEEKVGAKREATTNIQHFRFPLRPDAYTRHMMSQLRVNWEIYSTASSNEKATFFDDNAPVVHRNTLRPLFGLAQEPKPHFVSKEIVDVARLRGAYDREPSLNSAASTFDYDWNYVQNRFGI